MKKKIDIVAQTVTFRFDGLEPVTLAWADISLENQAYAGLFGLGHRLGDNAAISKSAENNWRVTEAMRRDAVLELVNHYKSGSPEWELPSKGAPRAAPQNAFVAELARRQGITYDEALANLANQALADLEPAPAAPTEMVYQVEQIALPAPN